MFKIDMHVHTSQVSVCGKVDAESIVREYKNIGYSGIVITDHFNKRTFESLNGETWKEKVDAFLEGYHIAKKTGDETGLSVYLGMELKTTENNNEFLCYGFDENFLYENENLFLKPIAEIKKIADEHGIIIIQAHPCRDVCMAADPESIHGTEVFNGHFNHNSRNDRAKEICIKNKGIPLSGSDAHNKCDIGNGGILFCEKPENIATALKEGNYSIIETKPQRAKFLFADIRYTKEYISEKIKNEDYDAAIINDDEFKVILKNGEDAVFNDGVCVINRCHIVKGEENLKKVPVSEQTILLTDEICEKKKELIYKSGAVFVCGKKGDDLMPYEEEYTAFAAFNMIPFVNMMFSVKLAGPSVKVDRVLN